MVDSFDPKAIQGASADTDSRVYVNGTRIPMANLDLYIRNEGPLDIGYYVEGQFPSPAPWGTDYLDVFNAYSEKESGGFDELYIELQDSVVGYHYPAFHGVVTGVGNAAGDTPSSLWQFRAQGPSFFMDKIPAGQSFDKGNVYADALAYIRERLSAKLPFDVAAGSRITAATDNSPSFLFLDDTGDKTGYKVTSDIELPATGALDAGVKIGQNLASGDGVVESITDGVLGELDVKEAAKDSEYNPTSRKTFTKNKHTLADVANWVGNMTNTQIYCLPHLNGIMLTFNEQNVVHTHKAHYLDGYTRVIENNALSEISPLNTLTVNGRAARTLGSIGDFEVQTPSDKYYSATARHKPLYQYAGNTELHASTLTNTGANSKSEVEAEAKKLLKKRIREATGGDMTLQLRHPIQPFDTIEAKPTCANADGTDTEPLTHSVTRVHHKVRTEQISTTEVNVGIAVEGDDVQIVDDSGWEQTGSGGDDDSGIEIPQDGPLPVAP